MGGDGGGSGGKWEEGEGGWEIEQWLLHVALYGLGAAVLGHLVLPLEAAQRQRGKEKREEPFSGEDTDPLWLRAIAWVVGCLLGVVELSVVKVLWALVTLCVYYASKAPFYVQSLLAQRGSRVLRDVEYGPHPRNRLDVYRPEPALAAACGSGEYGRAVIMMVHGGAWFLGDKLYFAKVQGASFPDCTVVPINYTLHPHADCNQMVKDVSLAIGWTYQNLCRADRLPLVVMGHSAGAHLVMLCATYRCLANAAPSLLPQVPRSLVPWPWEPEHVSAFVGCSGVYHISEHYLHEQSRGVHLISPMCGNQKTTLRITTAGMAPPVMGLDPARWDMYSPRSVVEAAFARAPQEPARVHFGQSEADSEGAREGARGAGASTSGRAVERRGAEARPGGGGMQRRLPRVALYHGSDDVTVPVQASVRFFEALTRYGQDCSLHYIAGGDHTEATCLCLTDTSNSWRHQLASDILSTALAHHSPSSPEA